MRGIQRVGGCNWRLFVAAALCLSFRVSGAPLPDASWLQGVSLLAHSVRDQSVVLQMPDGERHLLVGGEKLPGIYDLILLKVLEHRVEVIATHPSLSDRKLKLWFEPGSQGTQIVSSSPDESETPPTQGVIPLGSPQTRQLGDGG